MARKKATTPQAPENSRKMLISLLHGGTGHTEDYIECAIYEATAEQPEVPVYIVHNFNAQGVNVGMFRSIDKEHACNMYLLQNRAAEVLEPRTPLTEAEMQAIHNAIPIVNTGRRIPEAQQDSRHDILNIFE